MSVAIEFEPDFDDAFDGGDAGGSGVGSGGAGGRGRPVLWAVPDPVPARRSAPRRVPAASPVPSSVPGVAPGVSVRELRPPSDLGPGLRLTRRGVVVLALAAGLLGLCLVWLAAMSAPGRGASADPGPAVVTVSPGDTLWSIASRVAPDRDPRAEVDHLRGINHLSGVDLVPGQQLRVR